MDLQDFDFDDLQWSPPTSPLLQNNDEGQDRLTPTPRQTPLIDLEMDNISSYSSGDEVEPIGQVGRVEYFRDDPMTPIYGMFSKSLDTKVQGGKMYGSAGAPLQGSWHFAKEAWPKPNLKRCLYILINYGL